MKHVILIRVVLILADIGVIYLGASILRTMGRSVKSTALYALNPLVIVELTGNLHYEGLMICLTLAGIRLLMYWNKEVKSIVSLLAGTLAIGLGVLTKVVLILSLPAMWRRWGAGKTIAIGVLSLSFTLLGFRYFIDLASFQNMATSYDLYFRNFEFNASIYNLSLHVASHWIPHFTAETIGPWVSLVMAVLIVAIGLLRRARDWENYFISLMLILTVHLLFSSTVHPWYVVNLVAIGMFTNYRYAVLWSYMVIWSYHMYALDYHEVWWVVALQYVLLLSYMIWEWTKERPFAHVQVGGAQE